MTSKYDAADAERRLAELHNAISGMATLHSFGLFMEALRDLQQQATLAACGAAAVGNVPASQMELGAVRAYQEIIDLYEQHAGKSRVVD